MKWELSPDGKTIVMDMKVYVQPAVENTATLEAIDSSGWYEAGTFTEAPKPDSEAIIEKWLGPYSSKFILGEAVRPSEEDFTPPPVKPATCPHCERDWHPGPLTRIVIDMLESHRFIPDYNPDTDNSPILCVGAEYHGPNRPRLSVGATWSFIAGGKAPGSQPNWLNEVISTTQKYLNEMVTVTWPTWTFTTTHSMWVSGFHDAGSWWKPPKPKPCELPEELPTIEFGPQNWTPPADPVALPQPVKHLVWSYWDDLTQQDIPTPERPGYDFSEYANEISYPTSGKKAWT